jgi:hypothetical protein
MTLEKPSDFFVGVTELFSVILPGTCITYICLQLERSAKPEMDILGLRHLGGRNEGYLAFLAVSYLLGHVLDMGGAFFLDNLYDLTYAHWKRSHPMSVTEWVWHCPGRFAEELGQLWRSVFDSRMTESVRLEDALLQDAKRLAGPAMPRGDRAYQWCRAWIAVKNPAAFSEIERLQANSKFFRGIVMVSLITAVISFRSNYLFGRTGSFFCLLLAALSFIRFSDLRWKAVQQTYRFFIALRSEPAAVVAKVEGAT